MEAATSFSSRRPAAGALPAFSLPPPTADVPRAGDGISPSLSSVNTGSSQGSQAPGNMQYTYSGHVHGGWAPHANSSYSVGGAPQSLGQPTYTGRPSIYGQPSSMAFNSHRSSQSPATGGEGLPPPPYDQVHQPFQTPISGGGPGSAQQPPTPSSASGHVDAYTHTRPPTTPSYYTPSSTPQQQSFPAYTTQPSPTHASPTTSGPGPRGLGSISSQSSAMAPPAPYRPYQSYSTLPNMAGPVMSNIHQPGAQMSMISGMGVPQGYASHPIMYGHAQAAPQNERPFKCDQCVQSFSRNHDLKRHKRIHLAVKPFPCSYCSKSFSRKDALKRHRLVKGCENKGADGTNGDDASSDRNGDDEDSPIMKKE